MPDARDSTSNWVVVFPGGSSTIRSEPSGNSSFWLVSRIRTRTRWSVEFSMLSGTDARRDVSRNVRLGGAMIRPVTLATSEAIVASRAVLTAGPVWGTPLAGVTVELVADLGDEWVLGADHRRERLHLVRARRYPAGVTGAEPRATRGEAPDVRACRRRSRPGRSRRCR